MAKKSGYFDLVDGILNEISKSLDEVTSEFSEGKGKKSKVVSSGKNKNKSKTTKKAKQNKVIDESNEGKSMMNSSVEGVGFEGESLEGKSMMNSSMEGKTQMNYSLEGSNEESKIYSYENEIFKEKKSKEILKLLEKNDIKRGLILSEILGKPKSLRD